MRFEYDFPTARGYNEYVCGLNSVYFMRLLSHMYSERLRALKCIKPVLKVRCLGGIADSIPGLAT